MNLYSIYDAKAEAFMMPFSATNDGFATRMLLDSASDPATSLYKHPEDFSLFRLASYEENTGVITPVVPVACVGTLITLIGINHRTVDRTVSEISTKETLAEYEATRSTTES
jgi:hypothetical protein